MCVWVDGYTPALLRRPSHGGDRLENVRVEDDLSILQYDVACGPQQLAKYLANMRMLVLSLARGPLISHPA